MRQFSPARRAVIALLATLQMAVPALVAAADARVPTGVGAAASSHIEDHSRRGCRAVHPDDCSLCQLLSHLALQRTTGPVVPGSGDASALIDRDATSLPSYSARALQRSRAPPVG